MEIWKDIAGYEGYQVSNLGTVKSLERECKGNKGCTFIRKGKVLSPKTHKNGYLIVGLCKDSKMKMYYIHRLVAEAFIQNPNNYPIINHKDENKQNNYIENLEWCDKSYNALYGSCPQRKRDKIKGKKSKRVYTYKPILCIETGVVYKSAKELSVILNVNIPCIYYHCKRFINSSINNLHYKFLDQ